MPLLRLFSSYKMSKNVQQVMFDIFSKAVSSVLPANLISAHLKYDPNKDTLKIFSTDFNLSNKNVHMVGAGKAVPGMAAEVMKVLGSRLSSGILSVPVGSSKTCDLSLYDKVRLYEGAVNNQPDENSVRATKAIIELVKSFDENSFLLVLVSGGGSALLCSPLPSISLQEKSQLIQKLSSSGADIVQLNTVRKKLSTVKGGKLAILAHPAQVAALFISDIVGDHLEYIASGPTCLNNDKRLDAASIAEKYISLEDAPESVKSGLFSAAEAASFPVDLQVSNFMLGNNKKALSAAKEEAENKGLTTYVLSDAIQGDVENISLQYCNLISLIVKSLSKSLKTDDAKAAYKGLQSIGLNSEDVLNDILNVNIPYASKGLCLIFGGEPTVRVSGSGKGGRSQHLALGLSVNLHSEKQRTRELQEYDVLVLCAGTDGIDGPTDAAGAVGYDDLIPDALKQNLSPEVYLSNNDSYNFFSAFSNGRNHIKIGHTGTNVMDVHIIIISEKEEDAVTLFIC